MNNSLNLSNKGYETDSRLWQCINNLTLLQGVIRDLKMKHSEQNETLAFDLQDTFVHTLTSSFGTLTMFNTDIRHNNSIKIAISQKA